jgi:hypothetical protein
MHVISIQNKLYRVFYSFSRTLKSYKKIIYDRLVTVDSLF